MAKATKIKASKKKTSSQSSKKTKQSTKSSKKASVRSATKTSRSPKKSSVKATKKKAASSKLKKPKETTKLAKARAIGLEAKKAESMDDRPLSPRLLESLEKFRKSTSNVLSAPKKKGKRRGRRPKSTSYDAMNDDGSDSDTQGQGDYATLHYDTGIKASESSDDGFMSIDRFEDYDEELVFD